MKSFPNVVFICISLMINDVEHLLFKSFIYLFIYFKRHGKKGRETSVCGCLLHTPNWGPGLQPRCVPWQGITPATLWFTGQHSVHWATLPGAERLFMYACCSFVYLIWNICIGPFFKKIFTFREKGREGERGREALIGCLSCAPNWGPGPQPRHVPWQEIELVPFPFTGWCSSPWATPARAI